MLAGCRSAVSTTIFQGGTGFDSMSDSMTLPACGLSPM